MRSPLIPGKVVSASAILTAVGDALSAIRQNDRLTWVDVGRVLGRSDDQAPKYADGSAEMGIVAYAFAAEKWGSRFTGRLDALLESSRPAVNAREVEGSVLAAALQLSIGLADGELTDAEIAASRPTLEAARDAIDGLLARLGPKSGLSNQR